MTRKPNLEVFVNQMNGHNKIITGFARLDSELDGDGQFTHVLVGDELLKEILDAWVEVDKGQRRYALVGDERHTYVVVSWIEGAAPRGEQLRMVTVPVDDDTWMIPLDRVANALPGYHMSWEYLLIASPEGS